MVQRDVAGQKIARGYATVDAARVHEEAPGGIDAMRRFMDVVARVAGS